MTENGQIYVLLSEPCNSLSCVIKRITDNFPAVQKYLLTYSRYFLCNAGLVPYESCKNIFLDFYSILV